MARGIEALIDTDELIAELRRYLVAVEAFRAEGRGPSGSARSATVRGSKTRRTKLAKSASNAGARDALLPDNSAIALPTKLSR